MTVGQEKAVSARRTHAGVPFSAKMRCTTPDHCDESETRGLEATRSSAEGERESCFW